MWVFRKSVKGNTALHDCAESGSLEIMKLLIASGARIDVDAYGGFLLISVVDSHWFQSVRFRIQGAKPNADPCRSILFRIPVKWW